MVANGSALLFSVALLQNLRSVGCVLQEFEEIFLRVQLDGFCVTSRECECQGKTHEGRFDFSI